MNIGNLLFSLLLINSINGFIVLPYIQIDFAYYFRLAQCQAKCVYKVGSYYFKFYSTSYRLALQKDLFFNFTSLLIFCKFLQ